MIQQRQASFSSTELKKMLCSLSRGHKSQKISPLAASACMLEVYFAPLRHVAENNYVCIELWDIHAFFKVDLQNRKYIVLFF